MLLAPRRSHDRHLGWLEAAPLHRPGDHAPKILFLDEATSHLEGRSEALVSHAVKAMGMTRVVGAHRKETIATADRVLAVDPGAGIVREVPVGENETLDEAA